MDFEELTKELSQRDLKVGSFLEDVIEDFYRNFLVEGDSAIDGGAHVGRHTLPMSRAVGNTGAVFAFEPALEMMRWLITVIEREECPNVYLSQFALSEKTSVLDFRFLADAPAYSGLQERSYPEGTSPPQIRSVLAVKLDQVIPDRHNVKFIKLDLEGGEFHAMRGALDILTTKRPVISFENGRQQCANHYKYGMEQFFQFFENLDYRLWSIMGEPFTRNEWSKMPYVWNFWAIPREDEASVELMRASVDRIYRDLVKDSASSIPASS